MKEAPIRMEFSGERYVPELSGNIELEHLHRYLLACQIANGKTVLDIASGEGYGSAMLAKHATKVIGVDISPDAVMHARQRYINHNLQYMVGSCSEIPLPDSSIDLVVSFETIEHHDQHDQMMTEIKRVLKPSGTLLISSPDKYHYTIEPDVTNPYHLKELYAHEFKHLIEEHFDQVAYFGQRIAYGSIVSPESFSSFTRNYLKEQSQLIDANGTIRPLYWVALASNSNLPEVRAGILERPINESEIVNNWTAIVQQRDKRIAELEGTQNELKGQISAFNDGLVERDGTILNLNQIALERDAQITSLRHTLSERDSQLTGLTQTLFERDRQIAGLCQTIAKQEEQVLALSISYDERNAVITSLLSSRSWLITKPLRWVGRVLRGDFSSAIDPIQKILKKKNRYS
jgi:ubiquinone/menaquinone biosynthesis C-methylase UbiE